MTKIKNVYFKNIKIREIPKAENDKINYENKIFATWQHRDWLVNN